MIPQQNIIINFEIHAKISSNYKNPNIDSQGGQKGKKTSIMT